MNIHYDNQWNANEWFVVIVLILGYTLNALLPRRFPVQWSVVLTLYGIFTGLMIDHSISVKPVDYYDVNDNSGYELMDFLTYVMYGSFSYLFAYLHYWRKIKSSLNPLYVLCWALLSLGMEWLSVIAGVFHYKNGYVIYYSFPIYLLMISLYLLFLQKMKPHLSYR